MSEPYDDFYDDDDDPWESEDSIQDELDTARVLSMVSHAQIMGDNLGDPDAINQLRHIGEYINLLEAHLEALLLVTGIESD
jgi:hypothetical protein